VLITCRFQGAFLQLQPESDNVSNICLAIIHNVLSSSNDSKDMRISDCIEVTNRDTALINETSLSLRMPIGSS